MRMDPSTVPLSAPAILIRVPLAPSKLLMTGANKEVLAFTAFPIEHWRQDLVDRSARNGSTKN